MPPSDRTTDPSLRALEALRGYAAIVVVFHHFALGFLPDFKARMAEGLPAYTIGWLLNGTGAVYVFFLLSGFVLTRKYYENGDAKVLASAAVKRLPRLWPPAAYGVLLGYLALRFHLNANGAAAVVTGSEWLARFGYADQTHEVSLLRALTESVRLFLRARALQFNSNLWTMVIEFYGSLLALFAAFALAGRLQGNRPRLLKAGLLLALLVLNIAIPRGYGWTFTAGAALAYAFSRDYFLPKSLALALGALGLCLLGSPVSWASMLGAALIVLSVTTPGVAPGFLIGRIGQICGRWSFPIYITHTIGVLTLGSYIYLISASLGAPLQLLASLIATWAFAIFFAYPIVRWEAWYLPRLNAATRRLLAPKS